MKRTALQIVFLMFASLAAYTLANQVMPPVDAYRSPLKDYPPAPGSPLGEPLTRRVVFVLVDGLRLDVSQTMPYLNELRRQGASAAMHSRAPSISTPSYGVLMTGAWPSLSDVPTMNLTLETIWPMTQDNIFASARRAGGKTAFIGNVWFSVLIPAGQRDAGSFLEGQSRSVDLAAVEAALPWLDDPSYTLVMIHLGQVDQAGHHEGGGAGEGYAAAARRVDDLLRRIAAPLDLAQDTLLVASDHGHLDRADGGHGGPEAIVTSEPFVLVGAGVVPGVYPDLRMVDLAPTVAALLGGNLPAASQGQVQAHMLALSPGQRERLPGLQAAQQKDFLAALHAATRLPVDDPAVYQPAGDRQGRRLEAVLDRGFTVRLLAGLVALGALAAGVAAWARRNGRRVLWVLGGAAVYGVLFHVLYTIVLQRTYSLSSVDSASDLITATLKAAAPALLLAWLILRVVLRRLDTRLAAPGWRLALDLTLAVLALLALPVLLHLVWNGPRPGFRLPDYWTLFLGLLALVQMVLVAPSGLLIAAISSLVAWGLGRRPLQVTRPGPM